MGQSNVIGGALALAFLLFITIRGELPKYLALFKARSHQQVSQSPSGDPSSWGGVSDLWAKAQQLENFGSKLSSVIGSGSFGGNISYGNSSGGSIGDGSTANI